MAYDTSNFEQADYTEVPFVPTASARARDAVHFYAERYTANDLERIMGRSQKKDTTLDHLPAATVTKASVELER